MEGIGWKRANHLPQSLIPVVMSGIIAVYSLVIAVLIASDMGPPPEQVYSLYKYEKCAQEKRIRLTKVVVSCISHADSVSV